MPRPLDRARAFTSAMIRPVLDTAELDDEDAYEHLVGALSGMGSDQVWVLLRCAYERPNDSEPPETTILGIYATEAGLDARIERIRQANVEYPLQVVGPHEWRIGPDEDQGLFGHRDYRLWAVCRPLGA